MVTNSALFAPEAAEIDLPRIAVRPDDTFEPERHKVGREDSQDARMHLLRTARGLCAVVQRGRVSFGVFFLQVSEERVDRPSDGKLEHADYRRHVLRLVGQGLEHVGDIGREVVRCSKRPKGVARMLVNRADG